MHSRTQMTAEKSRNADGNGGEEASDELVAFRTPAAGQASSTTTSFSCFSWSSIDGSSKSLMWKLPAVLRKVKPS